MTYTLKTASRHSSKFHRTPGAVSHCAETTGVFPDSIHRIVGPIVRGPTSERCLSGWASVKKKNSLLRRRAYLPEQI